MNQTVKLVRDYYNSGFQQRKLDTELLTVCVENLSDEDVAYIKRNGTATLHSSDSQYKFFMEKLLARYEDIVAGNTKVDEDGLICFTKSSSVIELCDDGQMYSDCKSCGIKRISDVQQEANISGLPIGVVSRLLAALMVFQVTA